MGVGIALEFLAGRYHANPWGRHVNEGQVEWPPSPWRLLRALVDAWHRQGRPQEGEFKALLSALRRAPVIYLPPSLPGCSRHFLPGEEFLQWGPKRPGRKEKDNVLDSFRVLPEGGRVVFWWEGVDLEAPLLDLLRRLAARLTYLGRVESWCRAEVVLSPPSEGFRCEPRAAREGEEEVLLPAPDPQADGARLLRGLATPTGELRPRGQTLPEGASRQVYAVPRDALEPPLSRRPRGREVRYEVARFALGGQVLPPVTEAVALGYAFRKAAMASFGRLNGGDNAPLLSGRGPDGRPLKGHRHAHYLPTDEDGDGRLDHLTVWCPEGLGPEEVSALERVVEVHAPELAYPVRALLVRVGSREDLAGVDLFKEAREWISLTPFVPVRHPKRRNGVWVDTPGDQVALEVERRGLPRPVEVEAYQGARPWSAFRRWHRGGGTSAGFLGYGFRLRFAEPVRGPLALGYGAHYGLGLFVPDAGERGP